MAVEDSGKAFMVTEGTRSPHWVPNPLAALTAHHFGTDLFPPHAHLSNSRPCVLLEDFIAAL